MEFELSELIKQYKASTVIMKQAIAEYNKAVEKLSQPQYIEAMKKFGGLEEFTKRNLEDQAVIKKLKQQNARIEKNIKKLRRKVAAIKNKKKPL